MNGIRTLSFLALASGCNNHEYFNVAGYAQANYSNDADVIFVIDNSTSMREEASDLALNFTSFIDTLTSEAGGAQSTNGLVDAATNFIDLNANHGRYIDYQLAITTTAVDPLLGESTALEPGEAGWLVGDPAILSKWDADVGDAFRRNILCEATYWKEDDIPADLTYECGDETDVITQQYLDCECGMGNWENNAGSGNEEPLEAALLAICRGVTDPPEVCFDPITPFTSSDMGSNNSPDRDLIRDDSTIVVVIVGDEADNSRRMEQGDTDPEVYLQAFESFDRPIRVVAIGPGWDGNAIPCNSGGAQTWMVERLQAVTSLTGGFYANMEERVDGNCSPTDYSGHLIELGQLLNDLLTSFQLQSVPNVDSIRAYTDGVEIQPATDADLIEPDASTPTYLQGWSYDSSQNAVTFWGPDIPTFSSEVRIYYRPLLGNPRQLPF